VNILWSPASVTARQAKELNGFETGFEAARTACFLSASLSSLAAAAAAAGCGNFTAC